MSKTIHYKPTGYSIFCRVVGAVDYDTAITEMGSGRCSTDIRRVTCPLCLHAIAASMIRKGVPIEFKKDGKTFYEHFVVNSSK
jgi:hypothetical protein